MDPIEEFRADWAFRQEKEAAEAERLTALEGPLREARQRLLQQLARVVPTLAEGIGARYLHEHSPFFDDRMVLCFHGVDVWFDLDHPSHKKSYVNLLSQRKGDREPVIQRVELLDLDETVITRKMLSALRHALNLRGRPREPIIPSDR